MIGRARSDDGPSVDQAVLNTVEKIARGLDRPARAGLDLRLSARVEDGVAGGIRARIAC
jgi:hypothetical protein